MTSVSVMQLTTVTELADLRPLIEAHIEYEQSSRVLADDWQHQIAKLIAAGKLVVFVAQDAGVSAGYAAATFAVSTWAGGTYGHLDCLYVDERKRGTGIGRILVGAVADLARHGGHSELQWQTPHWNGGAIRFYESLGATHQSKERFTLLL